MCVFPNFASFILSPSLPHPRDECAWEWQRERESLPIPLFSSDFFLKLILHQFQLVTKNEEFKKLELMFESVAVEDATVLPATPIAVSPRCVPPPLL